MTVVTHHFRAAWNAFLVCPRVFIVASLVFFLSWAVVEMLVIGFYHLGVPLNVALHVAFLLFASGLMVGMYHMALTALDGGIPTMKELTAYLLRSPSYLLAVFMYLVVVIAGLFLLVAPGIYAAVRFALFGPVIAKRPATAIEALREAGEISHGRWWRVGRVLFAAAALNLLGAALLGIGLFITWPVSLLATTSLFRSLEVGPRRSG